MADKVKGIVIEIGGDTTKLGKAIGDVNKSLSSTQKDLRDIERLLKIDPMNTELLAQKEKYLSEQVDNAAKKAEILKKAIEAAAKSEGEISSEEVDRLKRELIKAEAAGRDAQSALDKMKDAANDAAAARTALDKLASAADNVEDEADDAADALKDLGDAADDAGGSYSGLGDTIKGTAIGNIIADGVQAGIQALGNLAGKIVNLDESTEGFREAQNKIATAFETSGLGAENAQIAYQGFYEILGDTDTAAEASQLLSQLAENEYQVGLWTQTAAGVYGTFGDALPIEGLIEAANETAKVGEVSGVLADALNWAGISEDEFNQKLAMHGDEASRNELIMTTLASTYDDAADAFYRNNDALIRSRDAQIKTDQSMAKIGDSISKIKTKFSEEFAPVMDGIAEKLVSALDAIDWDSLIETIVSAIDSIDLNAAIDMFKSLMNILNALSPVFQAVAFVISVVVNAFSGLVDIVAKAVNAIKEFFSASGKSSGASSGGFSSGGGFGGGSPTVNVGLNTTYSGSMGQFARALGPSMSAEGNRAGNSLRGR